MLVVTVKRTLVIKYAMIYTPLNEGRR
jgi:hypothetical protein